jgi:uncharacterized membrane protein
MTQSDVIAADGGSKGNVNLIYILYLISLVVGVTGLVGVVMAYLGKAQAEPWLVSHYDNQINIFWKMLLYCLIGAVLTFVMIGMLIILTAVVWYVIRVVKGMQALTRNEPIAAPGSWAL